MTDWIDRIEGVTPSLRAYIKGKGDEAAFYLGMVADCLKEQFGQAVEVEKHGSSLTVHTAPSAHFEVEAYLTSKNVAFNRNI